MMASFPLDIDPDFTNAVIFLTFYHCKGALI
jgi:hypothetical protein